MSELERLHNFLLDEGFTPSFSNINSEYTYIAYFPGGNTDARPYIEVNLNLCSSEIAYKLYDANNIDIKLFDSSVITSIIIINSAFKWQSKNADISEYDYDSDIAVAENVDEFYKLYGIINNPFSYNTVFQSIKTGAENYIIKKLFDVLIDNGIEIDYQYVSDNMDVLQGFALYRDDCMLGEVIVNPITSNAELILYSDKDYNETYIEDVTKLTATEFSKILSKVIKNKRLQYDAKFWKLIKGVKSENFMYAKRFIKTMLNFNEDKDKYTPEIIKNIMASLIISRMPDNPDLMKLIEKYSK